MISSDLQILTHSQFPLSTFDDFADRINQEHQKCLKFPQLALIHGRNVGEELLHVQAQLSPEHWQVWLRETLPFSEQTAKMYMQIAQKMPGVNSEGLNSKWATETKQFNPPTEFDFPPQLPEISPSTLKPNFSNFVSLKVEKEVITSITPESELHKTKFSKITELEPEQVYPKSTPTDHSKKNQIKQTEINASETIIDVEFTPVSPPEPEAPQPKKPSTKNTIKFMIPGVVVPKARPRVTSNGTYLPPRYRAWRNHAEVEIYRQIAEQNLTYKFPLRKAAISIRLIGNHRTNSDIDNLAGACLDALTLNGAGVLMDDRLSCLPQLTVEYIPGGKQTGVWIEIEPL